MADQRYMKELDENKIRSLESPSENRIKRAETIDLPR